jgi:putative sugar O-methyltransferase
MFATLEKGRKETLPSNYWIHLNEINIAQLRNYGYDNFKRTVNRYYFTWFLRPNDSQFRALLAGLPIMSSIKNGLLTLVTDKHALFNIGQSLSYNFITRMMWEYASRQDHEGLLVRLSEPEEGNPPRVYSYGKLISQDLANSFLEFKLITDSIESDDLETIIELGGGYGRTAYVFLKILQNLKYIVVDIPPALYISERYLSSQFPQKKVFRFRPFNDYADIREEFSCSELAFFLPNQLDLLPDKVADLCINISSLHEMRPDQIQYYFRQIDRLTAKAFYFKEWKVSEIPFEDIKVTVTESDYPIPERWAQLFWRPCPVQPEFFEAMFRL